MLNVNRTLVLSTDKCFSQTGVLLACLCAASCFRCQSHRFTSPSASRARRTRTHDLPAPFGSCLVAMLATSITIFGSNAVCRQHMYPSCVWRFCVCVCVNRFPLPRVIIRQSRPTTDQRISPRSPKPPMHRRVQHDRVPRTVRFSL